jgi:hypothetical protein
MVSVTFGLLAAFGLPMRGQNAPAPRMGLVGDWSTHHLIFSNPGTLPEAMAQGRFDQWYRTATEPRYIMQQMRRYHLRDGPGTRHGHEGEPATRRDWAFSLGSGKVAQSMSPAKFAFDINATPSCTNDYVVYGLNATGATGGQANLVALNNLYSGASSGIFSSESLTNATVTITVNGTGYTFTASTTNSSTTYARSSNVSTQASNLMAAIGLNSSLTALVTAVANAPASGGVTVYPKAAGATITITASSSPASNFGSILNNSNAACGGPPNVYWAYNATNHSGTITTSPVISINGTAVIYVESVSSGGSYLHLLEWKSGEGTVSASAAPDYTASNTPACGGTSCLVSIQLKTTTGTSITSSTVTNSSPFYDYTNDIVYVGDDAGNLFKVTGVATSATPVVTGLAVASTYKLTGPVYDYNSGYIFVGATNGVLYAVTTSLTPAKNPSIQVGYSSCAGGAASLVDPPVVDSTQGFVFATSLVGNGSTYQNYTVVVQAYTTSTPSGTTGNTNYPGGSSWTAAATAEVGQGDPTCSSGTTSYAHAPTFDNAYYTSPTSGHLLAGGTDNQSSSECPGLWSVSFSGSPAVLTTATEFTGTGRIPGGNGCSTNHAEISPLTEIDNGSDYLFFGVGSGSYGELFGFTVTDSTPYFTAISGQPVAYPNGLGGTSAIVIDNVSGSAQASSLYFTTEATSTSVCGSSSAYCAIKLTQSALQ